jgi:hypothetical protein
MEFSLLQRFLFDFFICAYLTLRCQFTQAILTTVMLFDPLPELRIFLRENLLNLSGTIRHRFPSFEGYQAT